VLAKVVNCGGSSECRKFREGVFILFVSLAMQEVPGRLELGQPERDYELVEKVRKGPTVQGSFRKGPSEEKYSDDINEITMRKMFLQAKTRIGQKPSKAGRKRERKTETNHREEAPHKIMFWICFDLA
jgi:hypothetical protein